MRNLLTFLAVLLIYTAIHEGAHALTAMVLDEFKTFQVRFYGLEVIFNTPVEARNGFKWAIISGTGNLITIALGYGFFALRHRFIASRSTFVPGLGYWAGVLFLTLDPLNLSIGPLLYGGDAYGIAAGLNINRWLIQVVFLAVFLINRELAAQKLLPSYGVRTVHPLFRPWFPRIGLDSKQE